MVTTARIGAAYDAIAADYDRQLAGDLWIRRALWRRFARLFTEGAKVMDAGCGTGADTLHLAARGVRVTAVDASANMVAALWTKLASLPSAAQTAVEVRVGDVVDELCAAGPSTLDGIVSSFAALNTVDLAAFARAAARAVKPGGHLVLHLLSRRGRTRAVQVGGQSLDHLDLAAAEVYHRYFEAGFLLRRGYGLRFLLGPRLERWLPAPLLDLLGRLEGRLGALPPLRDAGRFFVLELERRRGRA